MDDKEEDVSGPYKNLERELAKAEKKRQEDMADIYKAIAQVYTLLGNTMLNKKQSFFKDHLPSILIGCLIGAAAMFLTLYFLP